MLLSDKVAVVYGAGGAIGGAVARAFEAEGARVFGAGREVDALDEQAVEQHVQSVIDEAGRVDISFDAIGIPDRDVVGVPLVEMDAARFSMPITAYATAYFLTARLAARRMIAQGSGVIMTATALLARTGVPLVGGYSPAMAAKDALTRDLSAELAPHGIRVVGLRPQAMPESDTIKEAYERRADATGMSWEQFQEFLATRTHPRRLMTLSEMADVAAFMASDRASGMTGTIVNLTMGSLDD
jgi:NAD(P)-dependent dehydrogenase (short-subunit alcohol dehydrogenase family)